MQSLPDRTFYIFQHGSFNMIDVTTTRVFNEGTGNIEPHPTHYTVDDFIIRGNTNITHHVPIFSFCTTHDVFLLFISDFVQYLVSNGMYEPGKISNRDLLNQHINNYMQTFTTRKANELVRQHNNDKLINEDVVNKPPTLTSLGTIQHDAPTKLTADKKAAINAEIEEAASRFTFTNANLVDFNGLGFNGFGFNGFGGARGDSVKNIDPDTPVTGDFAIKLRERLIKFVELYPYLNEFGEHKIHNVIISFSKNTNEEAELYFDIKYTDETNKLPTSVFKVPEDTATEDAAITAVRRYFSELKENGSSMLLSEIYKMIRFCHTAHNVRVVSYSCTRTPLTITDLMKLNYPHDYLDELKYLYLRYISIFGYTYTKSECKSCSNYGMVCLDEDCVTEIREYKNAIEWLEDFKSHIDVRGHELINTASRLINQIETHNDSSGHSTVSLKKRKSTNNNGSSPAPQSVEPSSSAPQSSKRRKLHPLVPRIPQIGGKNTRKQKRKTRKQKRKPRKLRKTQHKKHQKNQKHKQRKSRKSN